MELQVGVKILLKNKNGKYLLLFRSPEGGPYWDIPGGRIHAGLSLLESLKREVKEETGLEIAGEPKLIAAQDILRTDKNKHVVRLTYAGSSDGEVKLSEEHTDFRWLTLDEIRKLAPLDKYLEGILAGKLSINL